jgi:hypothetical protein
MKMEVTRILKQQSGLITVETKTKRSFLGIKLKPINRTFVANKEYPKGHWNWVEMPNKTLVNTITSFQLDEWVKWANEQKTKRKTEANCIHINQMLGEGGEH